MQQKNSIEYLKQKIQFIKQSAYKFLNFKFKELKHTTLQQLGWQFKFSTQLDNSTRGMCDSENKIIYINSDIVTSDVFDNKQLNEILLHEISHAIEYIQYGNTNHKYRYRKICYSVGKQTGYNGYMIYTDHIDLTDRELGDF